MTRIYLDNAAATPMDSRVLTVMEPFFCEIYQNPSALYKGAREARSSLEQARSTVSQLIGAKPAEIIFTAGGTESDNLAIKGVADKYPGKEILISSIEHDAVRVPAGGYNLKIIEVEESGRLSLESLKAQINENTVLISVMYVNNEIGTVQDLASVVKVIESERKNRAKKNNKTPIYIHTDACQAPLYLDINVARLGVDMMTLNGGKVHGPKQSGILYLKAGLALQAQIEGGGQEFGVRSGTENVAFAVGFAKSLELAHRGRSERARNVGILRDYFASQLEDKFQAQITGHRKHRIANNVHAIFDQKDNERILFALDDLGVDVATGSACSASSDDSSHVLRAVGKSESQARSSIRFSLGKDTTKDEIDKTLKLLEVALKA